MPTREHTFLEAIQAGINRAMREDSSVILYGEDVGAFGGAFKLTAGLLEEFGAQRVFDTPISESAIIGSAVGAALCGLRPVIELQFVDFATTALHQIINNAATTYYRTGNSVPLTLRAPCGGGFGGGPFHSEELETFFCHAPGLKVLYPASPSDARAMIQTAIQDPNPVVFLENKYLYRHVKEVLPERDELIPLGKARICCNGQDATILTYGAMVHEALKAATQIEEEDGYTVTVVDMRTLKPYDTKTVLAAVAATNRVLVLHEGWRTAGFGAELAAMVSEKAFHLLDAPVQRLTAPDVPVPYAPVLEAAYRPDANKIVESLRSLIEY